MSQTFKNCLQHWTILPAQLQLVLIIDCVFFFTISGIISFTNLAWYLNFPWPFCASLGFLLFCEKKERTLHVKLKNKTGKSDAETKSQKMSKTSIIRFLEINCGRERFCLYYVPLFANVLKLNCTPCFRKVTFFFPKPISLVKAQRITKHYF